MFIKCSSPKQNKVAVLQSASMEEAKAVFSLGRLTFQRLACGGRHIWKGYEDISKTIEEGDNAV